MIYILLKLLIRPVHRLFYNRIIVEGKENIPEGGVIFTPNHQNAMMDALAIINTSGRNPYFLARADFFSKAFFRFVLGLLRTIPVYRKKDGTQSLDKNGEVFDKASRLLTRNKSLVIFPEAGHNAQNRLQALRKGFVRVGFKAEEFVGFEKDIYVVPVGIFYSDPTRFRSKIHVRYGKPISFKNYKELYEKNPHKAYNVVKSAVAKRIIPMMINIKNQQHHDTFTRIVTMNSENLLPKLDMEKMTERNLFLSRQKVVYLLNQIEERTPEIFDEIKLKVDDYFNDMQRLNYTDKIVRDYLNSKMKLPFVSLLLIVTLPVYIFGFIHNILPYFIPKAVARRKADVHYKSSYKFGLGILTFGLFYGLEIILMSYLLSGYHLLGYAVLLPLTGMAAFYWHQLFSKARNFLRLRKAEKRKEGEVYEMLRKRKEAISTLDEAMHPYF